MTTSTPLLGRHHDRTDAPSGRTYRWGDEEFASVTTILSGGVPKPALLPWGIKAVAEAAVALTRSGELQRLVARDPAAAIDRLKRSPYDTRNRAATLGSAVHDAAEAHILGKPTGAPPPAVRPYTEQFERFLADHQPVYLAAECTVYHRAWAYAGTLDAIVNIGGETLVLDYKSGSGVYPEAVLQLAAYRYAEFLGLPDGSEVPLPPTAGAAVLWLQPDRYRLVPVRADQEAFEFFTHATRIYAWAQVGKSFLEV